MVQFNKQFFIDESEKKIVKGDLFTYANPVIPIKTKGRTYGSISRQAVERGIKLPDLALGTALFQDPYIFVAFWSDDNAYTLEHFIECAAAVMSRSANAYVPLIAMPLLGGKEAMPNLWAVEKGLFDMGDIVNSMGFDIPEHIYVTR